MDKLRSALGLDQPKASPLMFNPQAEVTPSVSGKTTKDASQDVNNSSHGLMETVSTFGSTLKDCITKVVPLEEGDCLSCKLIGVSVLWGSAVFVVAQTSRVKEKYKGSSRMLFFVQIGLLSSALVTLGTARLFDIGLFEKQTEDERKGVAWYAKDDFNKLTKTWESISAAFKSSDSSEK